MKKILLSLIGGSLVVLGATSSFGAADEISKTKLTEKYAMAMEIKAKYALKGAALAKDVKSDPKDHITLELGEENAAEFVPSFKIARWDEVSVKIKPDLTTVASKDKAVSFIGDKVKVDTPDTSYSMYELPISEAYPEGAFEYEIELKNKPKTNVVTLNIESQGLDFFYQPALTQEEIAEGAERPENVVGSYAVYASENKINYVGGKEYKTGKVGHIYRPKIVDSAGTEVWGDLHIENGILSVTIPQSFLDTAVYPVRHAAGLTFGYTTLGASFGGNTAQIYFYQATGAEGNLTTLTAGVKASSGGAKLVETGIYIVSSGARVYGPATNNWTPPDTTNAYWVDSTVSGSPAVSAITYWLGVETKVGYYLAYDGTAGATAKYNSGFDYTWPDPIGSLFTLNRNHAIYATYTAGGGGGGATPNNDVIFFE